MESDGGYDLSGAIGISGHLYDYVEILQTTVFIGSNLKEIHQFALSIGIALPRKLVRSQFRSVDEGGTDLHPGSQFATHSNITGILNMLSVSGMLNDDQKPNEQISEYINGGLEFLKEIKFEEQTDSSYQLLFEALPHLNSENIESEND